MFNLKSAWAGLCSAVFICNLSYAAEIGHVPISLDNALTHSHTTQGLEPIQASYQIAKLQFLPDLKDSENGWAGNKIGGTYNKNDCSAYSLKSCPTGAKCSKCPFAKKYKINSCSAPFILSEGACVCPAVVALVYPNDVCTAYCSPKAGTTRRCIKKSCTPSPDQTGCTKGTQLCDNGCGKLTRKCCNACVSRAISKPANSHFINYTSCIDGDGTHDTPGGWACDSGYHKSADGKSCIKDCNVTNCAGYTLPSCPPNGNCSDCTKTAANCSTNGTMYKLDSCKTGYSKSGEACIDNPCPGYEKKSSCPNRYYKKTTCLADTSYIKCEETCGSQIVNDNPTYSIDESNYNTNGTAVVTKDATSIPYASNVYSNINFPQYALCKNLPKPTIRSSSTTLSFNRIENINFIFTGKVSDTPVYGLELNPSGETTNAFNNDAQKSWIGYLKNVDITITSNPVVGIKIGGGAWYNKTIVFEGTNKVTGGTTYTFWLRGHNSNSYGHVKGVLRIANGATLNAASICEYTQWNGILQKYGTFTGNVKTNCSTYTLKF